MIEEGFYTLITDGLNDETIIGAAVELPKDTVNATTLKAWVYRSVQETPLYTMDDETEYVQGYFIVDCFGFTADDARDLAESVKSILRSNVAGCTLEDSDSTVVAMIRKLPRDFDGFDSDNRAFYRSLSYCINYYRSLGRVVAPDSAALSITSSLSLIGRFIT